MSLASSRQWQRKHIASLNSTGEKDRERFSHENWIGLPGSTLSILLHVNALINDTQKAYDASHVAQYA